jgi:hypothetical protein
MLHASKAFFFAFLKIGLISIFGMVGLLLIGTLLNFLSYRSVLPVIVITPSPESLGREYLQAVVQKNHNYISEDSGCARGQLLRDIAKYDGAEIRNIVVSAQWMSGNSDHQFEVTSIRFDYRFPKNPSWKSDEVRLMTATNLERSNSLLDALPFRRIHCAGPGV